MIYFKVSTVKEDASWVLTVLATARNSLRLLTHPSPELPGPLKARSVVSLDKLANRLDEAILDCHEWIRENGRSHG